MKKSIKCPNCGANLKPDAYYCDYCGAFFENNYEAVEENAQTINTYDSEVTFETANSTNKDYGNVNVPKISNVELNKKLRRKNKFSLQNIFDEDTSGSSFLIIFIVLLFTGLIFFVLFVWIFIALANDNKNSSKIIFYCNKGEYNEAYERLKIIEKTNKSNSIIIQLILIAFYRLDKFEEVENLISKLNTKPHIKDVDVIKVAKLLNIEYIRKQY